MPCITGLIWHRMRDNKNWKIFIKIHIWIELVICLHYWCLITKSAHLMFFKHQLFWWSIMTHSHDEPSTSPLFNNLVTFMIDGDHCSYNHFVATQMTALALRPFIIRTLVLSWIIETYMLNPTQMLHQKQSFGKRLKLSSTDIIYKRNVTSE